MKYGVTIFVLLSALIIAFPFAIIWALNTLFSLGIAYSFVNWLAVVVLKLFVFADNVSSNKKK